MPTDPFIAWAAGFFDGEGCVLLARMRPSGASNVGTLRLGIAVGQKVRDPLDALAERWGGTVRQLAEPRTDRHADKFDWRLYGTAAVAFLRDVRPYLRVKHRQADIGIAYGATIGRKGVTWRYGLPPEIVVARERMLVELRLLNRRGRAA
jgi:hypothetical protein